MIILQYVLLLLIGVIGPFICYFVVYNLIDVITLFVKSAILKNKKKKFKRRMEEKGKELKDL